MSISEAKARCANLDVRVWDTQAIADAVLAGTAALLSASPQVTPAAGTPGMWWVGAKGFDTLGGENWLAQILLHIAQHWHPHARVAIADSCVAARAATWAPLAQPITIIPQGRCAHYLASAPLGLIPMPSELREALFTLGFQTIGSFAALDASDVESRWGKEGLVIWRLAHGDDPRRPGMVRTEAPRQTTVELPDAIDNTAPLLFVVRAQLQRLLNQCVQDARAAASVAISLTLDAGRYLPLTEGDTTDDTTGDTTLQQSNTLPYRQYAQQPHKQSFGQSGFTPDILSIPHRTITREIRPARPLARLDPLFDQCRALLEQWKVPAPIIGISISIPATAPLPADQGDLLIPSWRDTAMNAEAVFARLRAVLDPEQSNSVVVRPQAYDTHRPEESGVWQPADALTMAAAPVPAQNTLQATDTDLAPSPVLRLLSPPEDIRVAAPHGAPGIIWWRGRCITFSTAHGPERLSGDWWRSDRYARDYWRCYSETDGELLIYRDGVQWYVHGWYD